MDQFERRRLVVGIIAFLLFSLVALAFAIPHIEDDRASATERQLQKAGITDVKVSFDGQDGTLTGPATLQTAALAAVKDRNGIRSLTYRTPTTTAPGAAGPTTTHPAGTATTAKPGAATTAAPTAALGVNGTVNGNTLTLTGGVPTAADKQALAAAAATGFGGKLANQVQVVGGAWTPPAKSAFDGLRTYLAAAGPRLQSGDVAISGGNLSGGGVAFSNEAAASLNQTLAKLKAGGVGVNAAIQNPPTADAALQNNLNALLERTGINFASASAAIDAHSKLVLDTAAQAIDAGPAVQIQIGGYTDNVGPEAQNKTLSLQRAQAVRLYLIAKGVAAGRLKAAGFGSTKPIADNATAAGRAANRRIEFTVTGS